jgi:hypothetical protein
MNMLRLIAAILLLGLLAACQPGSQMRIPPPSGFRVDTAPSERCGCPDSKYVTVVATQGSPRFSVVTMERNAYDPNSAMTRSKPTNYQLGTPNSQGLGCTVDRLPSDPDVCRVIRTFSVDGVMHPANLAQLSRERVLSIVAGRLDDASGGNQGAGHCAARCKADSGDCPTYDGTKTGDVSLGPRIAQFVGTFAPNDTIDVGRVMALTSGGANACGRTDIVGVAGLFSNAGSRCDIASSMGPMGNIKISVPDALQFKLTTPAANRFTVVFEKAAGAPRLELSGGSLPGTYNGPVNRVDYLDGLYAIEVNNKCLGVLTKSGV